MTVSMHIVAQDNAVISYEQYEVLEKSNGDFHIADAFGKPYKVVKRQNEKLKQQLLLPDSTKIDTTIYLESYHQTEVSTHLSHYYSTYIKSPTHSGDPNSATLSFVIDEKGKIKHITVLENLQNRCDNNWKIEYRNDVLIPPFFKEGRSYVTEYILLIEDICYCTCGVIERETIKNE